MSWKFKGNATIKFIIICSIILLTALTLKLLHPWEFDIKGTITKGLIGKQDLALMYSGDSAETFTRATSTGYTMTLNKIDWPGVDVCYVFGGGVTKTSTVIASAITAIGTTEKVEIYLSRGSWPVTGTLSIPANITIHFAVGAYLDGAVAFAGSFSEQVKCLSGQQIFSSTSTITFGVLSTLNPKQWGAKGDYSTDDTTTFQAALTATAGKGKFFIPNGGYVISTSLALPQNSNGRALLDLTIEGESRADTVLINAAPVANATIQDTGTTRGLLIENISFVGKTAYPNRGIQLSVVESSRFTNLSFDTYGDGIYITNHAMDVEFDHLFFWWDILSDILGYTTTIRYTSLTQGYSAIKICNGESDGSVYWANFVRFNNIWTNGGAYGINARPKTALGLTINQCGLDAWAANDGSKTGHNVPIYLENVYRSSIRDSHLNANAETATNRLITLKNCRNILLDSIQDDAFIPASATIVPTSSIRIEGATSDNIVQRDLVSAGNIDIHTDVPAYRTFSFENCRYTGGWKNDAKAPYIMDIYARNLYIETEGYAGTGAGFINTENPREVFTLANSATPSIKDCSGADSIWLTGGTTTITAIADGQRTGHKITIIAAHSVTLDYGPGNLIINGATDFVMAAGDTITLVRQADGNWYETGRSDNT